VGWDKFIAMAERAAVGNGGAATAAGPTGELMQRVDVQLKRLEQLSDRLEKLLAAHGALESLAPPLDLDDEPAAPAASPLTEPRTPWPGGDSWPNAREIEEEIRSMAVTHGWVSSTRVADRLGRKYGLLEDASDYGGLCLDIASMMVSLAEGDHNLEIDEPPNSAGECSAKLVENDWFAGGNTWLGAITSLSQIAADASPQYRKRVAEYLAHRQYTERGYSAGLRYEQHVRNAWRPRKPRSRGHKWEINPGAGVQA